MVMLNVLTGLVTWSNNIGDILQIWADVGIFAYALPFLLLFAVVFGILQATKMFGENKGVNIVIAVAIGLMALQFPFVPNFFATVFPYAGVGIAVLLTFLILTGLFVTGNERGWFITYFVVAALIALIVILSALSTSDWWGGNWWNEYWPMIVVMIVIGGLIAVVIVSSKSGGSGGRGKTPYTRVPWTSSS